MALNGKLLRQMDRHTILSSLCGAVGALALFLGCGPSVETDGSPPSANRSMTERPFALADGSQACDSGARRADLRYRAAERIYICAPGLNGAKISAAFPDRFGEFIGELNDPSAKSSDDETLYEVDETGYALIMIDIDRAAERGWVDLIIDRREKLSIYIDRALKIVPSVGRLLARADATVTFRLDGAVEGSEIEWIAPDGEGVIEILPATDRPIRASCAIGPNYNSNEEYGSYLIEARLSDQVATAQLVLIKPDPTDPSAQDCHTARFYISPASGSKEGLVSLILIDPDLDGQDTPQIQIAYPDRRDMPPDPVLLVSERPGDDSALFFQKWIKLDCPSCALGARIEFSHKDARGNDCEPSVESKSYSVSAD